MTRRRILAASIAVALLFVGGYVGIRAKYELERKGCVQPFARPAEIALPDVPADRVRFIALGDTGTGDAAQRQVAQAAQTVCREAGCDFVLLLGDNFYQRGVESWADDAFQERFEAMYGPIGRPVFPVLGNHDVKGSALSQVVYSSMSRYWRMPAYNYSFTAGPARFQAINTNCRPFDLSGLSGDLPEDDGRWVFVFGHHPLDSTGGHGSADALSNLVWETLLEDRVDFYLGAHNHLLEHLVEPGERAQYIVSGAGARMQGDGKPQAVTTADADSRFRWDGGGLVWFEVGAAGVSTVFYDENARALHQSARAPTATQQPYWARLASSTAGNGIAGGEIAGGGPAGSGTAAGRTAPD